MNTTAIDVTNRKLSRSFRGYRTSDVDDLVREVAAELEAAARDRARLEDQIDAMHAEVARYKEMEETLNNAILLAQRSADELRAAAHRDADVIIRDAELRAREITEQAAQKNMELLNETRRLAERRAMLVDSLRSAARDLSDWIQSRRWEEVIELAELQDRQQPADDPQESEADGHLPASRQAAG